jgi:hypothetical protein
MQWVTITFTHQNVSRNHGLYSSILQKINSCTNKTKKLRGANPNIFQSKVTVQVKPTELSNDSIPKLCSPQVSHILLHTNLEKLVSNVTIIYYTQYVHGQHPSAPVRDLKLHYGLLSIFKEALSITESYQFITFGNCINNCMHTLSYHSVCIYVYVYIFIFM